jgi:hypothetical protein
MERARLSAFESDTVRVPLETQILRRLVRRYGDELWASIPSSEEVRRAWLAGAVGFSPDLAPRGLGVASEARRVLGVEESVQLYRAADGESRACIAVTERGPLHIRIHDVFLAHPDDAVLLFVMGHEIGHYLAHAPGKLRGPDPRLIYRWFARGRRAGVREVAAAFCRAAELTADRIGLLACQDLDASLRTLMILSRGEPGLVVGDERAYLTACRERVQDLVRRKERAYGDTHPENEVRAFALWAFSESDAYRSLTGHGRGTQSLADVDRLVERLVGPSESADDEGLPDIPPCLVERAAEELGVVKERVREVTRTRLASLRRTGADVMQSLVREGGGPRGAREAPPDSRPEELDLPGDQEADDLEKRFAELERKMASQTSTPGLPDGEGQDPRSSGDVDDLERRFAELEKATASRADVLDEPS